MSFMRQSKFRHVFGKTKKRDECYDNIRFTKTTWEGTYCQVNPKFVAIMTDTANNASFLVLPLDQVSYNHHIFPNAYKSFFSGLDKCFINSQTCPLRPSVVPDESGRQRHHHHIFSL